MNIRKHYVSDFNIVFFVVAILAFIPAFFHWYVSMMLCAAGLTSLFVMRTEAESERRLMSLDRLEIFFESVSTLPDMTNIALCKEAKISFCGMIEYHLVCWPGDKDKNLREKYIPLYHAYLKYG